MTNVYLNVMVAGNRDERALRVCCRCDFVERVFRQLRYTVELSACAVHCRFEFVCARYHHLCSLRCVNCHDVRDRRTRRVCFRSVLSRSVLIVPFEFYSFFHCLCHELLLAMCVVFKCHSLLVSSHLHVSV